MADENLLQLQAVLLLPYLQTYRNQTKDPKAVQPSDPNLPIINNPNNILIFWPQTEDQRGGELFHFGLIETGGYRNGKI
jgi:hypothetical protein